MWLVTPSCFLSNTTKKKKKSVDKCKDWTVRSYDAKKCLVAPSSSFLFTMKIREAFIHCKDQIRVGSNVSKDCGHSLVFSLRGIKKKKKEKRLCIAIVRREWDVTLITPSCFLSKSKKKSC